MKTARKMAFVAFCLLTGAFPDSVLGAVQRPWTHLNFQNAPDDFQFAIVPDRCGGDYRGAFTNAKGTNVSDYNCAFRNPRTGQVAPSRRLESWYQGLVDFKLLKWCRLRLAERKKQGEDVSKIKAKLERLIRDADVPRGDFEKIRVRLANIARMLAK